MLFYKKINFINLTKPGVLIVSALFSPLLFADHASPNFETGTAGAINTLSAATLPKNKWVFGVSTQFIEIDDIANDRLETLGANNEDVHSTDSFLSLSANVAYGLSDDLFIGFSLPYIDRQNIKEAENTGPGTGEAAQAGDSNGIGDLSLFGQYRFYARNNTDLATMIGLKTPTGDTSELELDGKLFEAEQQPGTGSWDPFIGISFNKSWDRIGIASNVLYTFVNDGTQNTNLGDIFNYNLAATYRAYNVEEGHDHSHHNHHHSSGMINYLDLTLELNGDYRKKVEIGGIKDSNTGGNTLYLSPGIRIGIARKFSVYSSFGFPIINDLNGIQSEPEFRITSGISTTF